ncbi:recombinase family protein [Paenirhodobacter sp. CAU 1674]|uniref:recombinase family protein n=1 Tax=Paenirhodobacter sp. CAU 1674 TaxID=3032596 RepID=UPI0023DA29D4|nr:recombinase family protein [Paenirhodobacter sp. CAU 1674]MDF2141731.1 recombinase family protein [Paenirhodobacter sp. CAU 1674]
MTTPATAIGYIRVSTEKQNEEDRALEKQADTIRRHCAERGIKLIGISEDICSAVGAHSLERRPSLSEATRWAAREGACLMVPEPTRLFRNVIVAERWLKSHDVAVYSVREGRILAHSEILNAVRSGQQVADATREGTVIALAKSREGGAVLGSKADRSAANKASAVARRLRSDEIVDLIAHVLLEDEAYRDLSHRALADLLNRRNILTGWQRLWTGDGLKRHRKLAEQRIEEWAEMERDDLPIEPVPLVVLKDDPVPAPISDLDEDEKEMRSNPQFGIF